MFFWLSWYELAKDFRPLRCPPGPSILGWWHTGDSVIGSTLVALVSAESEEEAWKSVAEDWPQEHGFKKRFGYEKDRSIKFSDRWEIKDWMRERLKAMEFDNFKE
jgi:hypothetical protein